VGAAEVAEAVVEAAVAVVAEAAVEAADSAKPKTLARASHEALRGLIGS
jgi:hypothetical protein